MPVRSVPSPMPSRLTSVKTIRCTPRSASEVATETTVWSVVWTQPRVVTNPSLASSDTTIRSPPCAATSSSTSSGCSRAAVPRIARCTPLVERGRDGLGGAQPAAGLHRHAECGDPAQMLGIGLGTVLGAVEVDHVQPLCAAVDPALGGVERVGVVGGLGVEVALAQPHGAAAADVDGGVEVHGHRASRAQMVTKFFARRPRRARRAHGALLRVALGAEDVAVGHDRRERRAVVAFGDDDRGVVGAATYECTW